MWKRGFDLLLSALGLLVSLPLWAVIAIAIKLDDGGPIFYRQPRVGKDGRVFLSLKFRSMVADADARTGAVPARENDPRITRVGRLLRATAMDELPQLWNIFRGEMSFVGPRPEWTLLVEQFRRQVSGFDRRHAVRPGLTGIAQLYGHSELPRRHKLRYDLFYIQKQNFWLDLRLLLLSFYVTLTGRWERRARKLPRLGAYRRQHRVARWAWARPAGLSPAAPEVAAAGKLERSAD
jgi:lipopolysaccharide/colanic/teichoic acid biosynthesis glycosyltransferase